VAANVRWRFRPPPPTTTPGRPWYRQYFNPGDMRAFCHANDRNLALSPQPRFPSMPTMSPSVALVCPLAPATLDSNRAL